VFTLTFRLLAQSIYPQILLPGGNTMFQRVFILTLLIFTPVNSLPGKLSIETKESANLSDNNWIKAENNHEPVKEKTFDEAENKALSIKDEIDLSKIKPIAPKGRIQDKEYNFQNQEMIERLIKHGKASIPFLIEKLTNKTKLPTNTINYWSEVTVADIALIILTDLFTDSSWKETTIPEAKWSYIIGYSEKSNKPFSEWLTHFTERHGRKPIKNKWQKAWKKYQNRIYWDEKEQCFNVK
jgi:hypothetical protein